MRIEILNTGSELMLGRVLNTHQQWLCRQLTDLGYPVERQVAVDDSSEAIEQAAREALERAELVIVTGGLGPTSDDRTRERIAALLGRTLREDATVLASIEAMFAGRRRPVPHSTRVQAMVPDGATVLSNSHGTAPGLVMEVPKPTHEAAGLPQGSKLLVLLPGPPRELHPMFLEQVVPLLKRHFPSREPFVCRTLKTTGLGESMVEERIAAPLAALTASGLELGYCARLGEVDLRLVARGPSASQKVSDAEQIARSLLGDLIYGVDDESLEAVLVRRLTDGRETLALAESCTGGWIANRITNVPGASAIFRAGWVTYSNEAKQRCLGVRAETLATHGAVSEAVAREMAEGARREAGGVSYAAAVTGIAGPSGGSAEKPVGTVWMAVASRSGTVTQRRMNPFDRESFKFVTSQQVLDLLRREMLGGGETSRK